MPRVAGLRSPYDKSVGGLHHLGRMLDKIRLKQAGNLPDDFHRNYGLSIGLDGQLCGFLDVKFADVAQNAHFSDRNVFSENLIGRQRTWH